ncbi:MAG TPA: toll/interleukin-1 receptor domain-containing protein, partial [Chloroflexi bacterium]|nr:toll/interleukin-1 receptor domain-containing protein [Chloroflexota bacterium]
MRPIWKLFFQIAPLPARHQADRVSALLTSTWSIYSTDHRPCQKSLLLPSSLTPPRHLCFHRAGQTPGEREGSAPMAGTSPAQEQDTRGRLIFISHAHADKEKYVLPFVERLQQAGYIVWFDQFDIKGGDKWKREIDRALRRCGAQLAVLTPTALTREWVIYEHQEAIRLFAPIVPVIVEEIGDRYPDYFAPVQYVKMIPPSYEDGAARYADADFAALQEALQKNMRRAGKELVDQTPPAGRKFIGREKELQELYRLMHGEDGTEPTPVAVTSQMTAALQGMGGIGKTMLAEELVRRLGPRYPGGVIVERRGRTPADAQGVLRRWAGYALGKEPEKEVSPDEVRGLLAGYGELLVLIDDIWPADRAAVAQLLAALPPDADRLLTTRYEDVAATLGAARYELDVLSEEDGLELLKDRLQKKKGPLPPDDLLKDLHGLLGGHALALELTAGQVRDNARFENLLERLEKRLHSGDVSEIALTAAGAAPRDRSNSLAASLDLSHALLQEMDRENGTALADRFAMLGVFAEEAPFDVAAAAAVWGVAEEEAEETLDALAGHALLTPTGDGRFRQHVILHAYALGRLREGGQGAEKAAARRHAEHYAALAEKYWSWNDAHRLQPELPNLAAAVDFARSRGESDLLYRLVLYSRHMLQMAGEWKRGEEWLGAALGALPEKEDEETRARRARLKGALADLARRRGDWEEAERLNREALQTFEQLGDRRSVAEIRGRLADLAPHLPEALREGLEAA